MWPVPYLCRVLLCLWCCWCERIVGRASGFGGGGGQHGGCAAVRGQRGGGTRAPFTRCALGSPPGRRGASHNGCGGSSDGQSYPRLLWPRRTVGFPTPSMSSRRPCVGRRCACRFGHAAGPLAPLFGRVPTTLTAREWRRPVRADGWHEHRHHQRSGACVRPSRH